MTHRTHRQAHATSPDTHHTLCAHIHTPRTRHSQHLTVTPGQGEGGEEALRRHVAAPHPSSRDGVARSFPEIACAVAPRTTNSALLSVSELGTLQGGVQPRYQTPGRNQGSDTGLTGPRCTSQRFPPCPPLNAHLPCPLLVRRGSSSRDDDPSEPSISERVLTVPQGTLAWWVGKPQELRLRARPAATARPHESARRADSCDGGGGELVRPRLGSRVGP